MRIYLDTCCYNRPFDDKNLMKIKLESPSKLLIQEKIQQGEYDLVWSYILDFENHCNPYEEKKINIRKWEKIAVYFCKYNETIDKKAKKLEKSGIKQKDAIHISCAINSNCSYFITTDYKLIKKNINEIKVINPIDFVSVDELS